MAADATTIKTGTEVVAKWNGTHAHMWESSGFPFVKACAIHLHVQIQMTWDTIKILHLFKNLFTKKCLLLHCVRERSSNQCWYSTAIFKIRSHKRGCSYNQRFRRLVSELVISRLLHCFYLCVQSALMTKRRVNGLWFCQKMLTLIFPQSAVQTVNVVNKSVVGMSQVVVIPVTISQRRRVLLM